MNRLVLPLISLRHVLHELTRAPRRPVLIGVGRHDAEHAWLGRQLLTPASDSESPLPHFRITSVERPPDLPAALPPRQEGCLFLGRGACQGRLWGLVRTPAGLQPLDHLDLPGAGMHRLACANTRNSADEPKPLPEDGRWSRTAGALGGTDVWRRLTQLHVGLVGCGRTGSLVAGTLIRLGLARLTLIDPDLVEEHNLGEMDGVTAGDVGRTKVDALAEHLRGLAQPVPLEVTAVPRPLAERPALAMARRCDVLVCCADNDAARLTAALVATLDHRVLLDVGTGVRFAAERILGLDVRLIVPGDGCLLCRGGLAHYQQALDDLCQRRPPALPSGTWRRQRAGSSRPLNQIAAGLAVQLLQDLVAERIEASTWVQAEIDPLGRLTVRPRAPHPGETACSLCSRAGQGDAVLGPK
jgi:molybdopterin/thiamine biosynthesis adenylyltransferase